MSIQDLPPELLTHIASFEGTARVNGQNPRLVSKLFNQIFGDEENMCEMEFKNAGKLLCVGRPKDSKPSNCSIYCKSQCPAWIPVVQELINSSVDAVFDGPAAFPVWRLSTTYAMFGTFEKHALYWANADEKQIAGMTVFPATGPSRRPDYDELLLLGDLSAYTRDNMYPSASVNQICKFIRTHDSYGPFFTIDLEWQIPSTSYSGPAVPEILLKTIWEISDGSTITTFTNVDGFYSASRTFTWSSKAPATLTVYHIVHESDFDEEGNVLDTHDIPKLFIKLSINSASDATWTVDFWQTELVQKNYNLHNSDDARQLSLLLQQANKLDIDYVTVSIGDAFVILPKTAPTVTSLSNRKRKMNLYSPISDSPEESEEEFEDDSEGYNENNNEDDNEF